MKQMRSRIFLVAALLSIVLPASQSSAAAAILRPGRRRVQAAEARAKDDRQGLWKGWIAAPREFRAGRKDGALLGAACRADRDREIREALFPENLVMPASCNIKGKYAVRARVTGNR